MTKLFYLQLLRPQPDVVPVEMLLLFLEDIFRIKFVLRPAAQEFQKDDIFRRGDVDGKARHHDRGTSHKGLTLEVIVGKEKINGNIGGAFERCAEKGDLFEVHRLVMNKNEFAARLKPFHKKGKVLLLERYKKIDVNRRPGRGPDADRQPPDQRVCNRGIVEETAQLLQGLDKRAVTHRCTSDTARSPPLPAAPHRLHAGGGSVSGARPA